MRAGRDKIWEFNKKILNCYGAGQEIAVPYAK